MCVRALPAKNSHPPSAVFGSLTGVLGFILCQEHQSFLGVACGTSHSHFRIQKPACGMFPAPARLHICLNVLFCVFLLSQYSQRRLITMQLVDIVWPRKVFYFEPTLPEALTK